MITIRKSEDRGQADYGWLKTRYSFSFANYFDPKHIGFRSLRVINEDYVGANRGFQPHDHDNMEIITYVLEGELKHGDSMGNGSVIHPNEIQRMTAGSGITHSEMNPSKTDTVHLLQIWIFPERQGLEPGYEQKMFPPEEKLNRLRLIASPDRAEGSAIIRQDVRVYASILEPGNRLTHELTESRHAWIQLVTGEVTVNGQTLKAGDGGAVSRESSLSIAGLQRSEFLLFDLA
jgi:quercetin 2,3-dioxygenase